MVGIICLTKQTRIGGTRIMELVWTVVMATVMIGVQGIEAGGMETIEDKQYWRKLAEDDILRALKVERNSGKAKNVILFIGDGMGPSTVTASRIYEKTERGYFTFERFPHMGAIKTYAADKIVPDSCSTATAIFGGVKANYKTSGVNPSVKIDDCKKSLDPSTHVDSFFKWAQDADKSTGFVTTTRVTHATPSALYAHTPNRKWECEDKIPVEAKSCKDIARQLVEDAPGKYINVIMGGGAQCLQSNVTNSSANPVDTWACYSKDGRDLIGDWCEEKRRRGVTHAVVRNTGELNELQKDVDYVLGIFANGHLKMEHLRDKGLSGMPSLAEMTEAAIKVLSKNREGYVLMVEGGLIDFAHHRGHARQALSETAAFDAAIETALRVTEAQAKETLIIVTSDHSHSNIITGYANRGTDITGIAGNSKLDNVPYTSLLYGTGGPDNYKYFVREGTVQREDPSMVDPTDFNYAQQAAILTDEVYHEGTDVLVYARGPMAHLFHSVHEQTYIAYVIGYAAKIGPYASSAYLLSSHLSILAFVMFTVIIIN